MKLKDYNVYYECNSRDHEQYVIIQAAHDKKSAINEAHRRIRAIGDIERYLITHVNLRRDI